MAPVIAWGVQLQIQATRDNTLYEDGAGQFSNGSGAHLYAGKTGTMGSEEIRRAVMLFDVSGIPPNSEVQSASVSLTINQVPTGPVAGNASLHRLTAAWGEGNSNAGSPGGAGDAAATGDATWIHRFYNSTQWSSAGGDFNGLPSATAAFGTSAPQTLVFSSASLAADVQGWVDDPSTNHGWIVIADEDTPRNARRFYSRESIGTQPALIPRVTVNFEPPSVTEDLELTEVASSLTGPIGIANANDGSGRLFIVERRGVIRIFNTATQTLVNNPYLDIQDIVDDSGSEQGLLGLAFHPNFSSNKFFYVLYVRDPAGTNQDRIVVARFTQSNVDAYVALEPGTTLMEFEHEAANHNGGDLHFGADGYLYISSGDGGGSNDQFNNAQNINSLKGKILRIDVDGSPPGAGVSDVCGLSAAYGIPPGNAFPGDGNGCDEILHIGLRNPWRFSFDAQTEEMFIGDVGQGNWEEVDMAPAGASGLNFGWSCREGAHAFGSGNACRPGPLTEPILEYQNTPSVACSGGDCAVVGGYVYRGSNGNLFGRYVYGDYGSDRIWIATRNGSAWTPEEWGAAASMLQSITGFGQDENCELYVADTDAGKVFRIDDNGYYRRSGFEARRCQ